MTHHLPFIHHMIPYASPSYFILLSIAFLPIIVSLLFRGKRILWYEALVTVFFLWISFGGRDYQQGLSLIGYVLFQLLLVEGYFYYRKRVNQSIVFYCAVILAILPLFLVKILPMLQPNQPTLFGFLGISYLTFKSVQVIMETRDGLIKELHPVQYIRFLLFFPTISSGPIDRYRRFLKDTTLPPSPNDYATLLEKGIWRIFLGFFYKFIIGYYLGSLLLPHISSLVLSAQGFSWYLFGYMYVYGMFLFFDFAGYSLFAVGVSHLMGYDTPMNFNKPFLAWNIKEFWNRWHMTLSFWFRDYVYMRLMFFLVKKKTFKSQIVCSNVGYFALFLLMGLWHGITWYYLVYGLYHASLICLTDAWIRWKKKHKGQYPSNKLTHYIAIVLNTHAVLLSFLIFSGILDKLFFS